MDSWCKGEVKRLEDRGTAARKVCKRERERERERGRWVVIGS